MSPQESMAEKQKTDGHRSKAEECLAFLRENDDFVVCGHPYPDGDSVGSVVALCEFLKDTGKTAQGVLFAPLPDRFTFLAGAERLSVFPHGMPERWGALVCLDVGAPDRITDLLDTIGLATPVLNMDHHTSNTDFGTLNWISDAVSAVGAMLYDVFDLSGAALSPAICRALYTAILTDSGRFCYRNTSPRTLEICADLMRRGVNAAEIFAHLYEISTPSRLALLAASLATLGRAFDGAVSWLTITSDMYSRTNSNADDSYNFIDLISGLKGTRVALIFREMDTQTVKVSVRTDNTISAHEICRASGGGGHRCAAGTILPGTIDSVRTALLRTIQPMLEE